VYETVWDPKLRTHGLETGDVCETLETRVLF
jgi:hypothetical protein